MTVNIRMKTAAQSHIFEPRRGHDIPFPRPKKSVATMPAMASGHEARENVSIRAMRFRPKTPETSHRLTLPLSVCIAKKRQSGRTMTR